MEQSNIVSQSASFAVRTCETGECSYFVESGSVDIYVASRAVNIGEVRKENAIYLCSVSQGNRLPSYDFRDRSHVCWYFILKGATKESCVTKHEVQLTEEEKLCFLARTPAAPFAYDEGINETNRFNDSLMEWFQAEEIRGNSGKPTEYYVNSSVFLNRTSEIYSDSKVAAYIVSQGSVNVFVGSSYSGDKRRLLNLCTLGQGAKIPRFALQDDGGVKWFFKIIAAGKSAELIKSQSELSASEVAQFLDSASVAAPEGGDDGYQYRIMDWYNTKLIKATIVPGETHSSGEILKAVSLSKHYIEGKLPLYRAISYVCYHCHIAHLSEEDAKISCGDDGMTVEKIAEASHFICRKVILEDGWWKSDCGPIIGFMDDVPVACVPKGGGRYAYYLGSADDATGEKALTARVARKISPNAYSIGRTLPEKKLTRKDLLDFCKESVNPVDMWMVVMFALISALIGILLPTLGQRIYDDYIPLGNDSQLIQICVVVISFQIGNLFFRIVKNISECRINSHVGYDLQNAAIYRCFYLPEKFFREHDSADLAQRILQIDEITTAYSSCFVIFGISALFSLVYLFKMFSYSVQLAWASMTVLVAYGAILYFLSMKAAAKETVILSANGEANTKIYQFLRAIDKVRMAGAEERAVYRYILPVRDREAAKIQKAKLLSLGTTLQSVAAPIFSMVLYYILIKRRLPLSVGSFIAFNTALGSFSSAILGLAAAIAEIQRTRPNLERIMPVFEAEPEYSSGRTGGLKAVANLNGEIKIEDLSFSYSEGGPMVLKNLSMTIHRGDYVGIVGKSGSGKSTLFKLLLGFEKPTSGRILIDGKNLSEMDKRSYRRHLGVVLQSSKLIDGSIQENITITAPGTKRGDVERVIRAVGLEEDISSMPMGINTMLSEGTGTISGGQQQRILIARALIGRPRVLLLDEATSALDNITQRMVYETIDKVDATKIVIAHRLSTIQNCSRIFVLDAGKIVETGTYDELMKKNGLFAEMAARQLVNGGSDDD